MASHIVSHSDVDPHYIASEKLEHVLFKLSHSHALSTVVSGWLSGMDSLSPEDKDHLMSLSFLQIDLMEEVQKCLPEL